MVKMAGLSIWHWIVVLAAWFGLIYPLFQIGKKLGKNPYISGLCIIPLGVFVVLFYYAAGEPRGPRPRE